MNILENTSKVTPLTPQDRPKTKVDWALSLAAKGFAIFPLHWTDAEGNCSCDKEECKPGKHPLLKGSFHDGTTDPAVIEKIWVDQPKANYGVYPGEKFTIIDLDTKHAGVDGIRSLADLLGISDIEVEGLTFSVRTPSGGLHLYFKADRSFGDKLGLLPGVDIRATGGYVVGPGSTIAGKTYTVINYIPLAPLPDKIASLLSEPRERDPKADIPLCDLDLDTNIERAIHFLKLREPAIEGQNGDDWTFKTAAAVTRDFAITEAKCLELMFEHWNDRCEPPWSYAELEIKVENADQYAKGRAGEKVGYALDEWIEQFGGDSADLPEDFGNRRKDVVESTALDKLYFRGATPFIKGLSRNREFIIPDWLPAQGFGGIIGKRGVGKSVIGVDALMHITCDMSWHGQPVDKDWAGIYLCGEDDVGVKDFIHAWMIKHGKEPDPDRFHIMAGIVNLLSAEDTERWTRFLKGKIGNRRAIVLGDTWQRGTSNASQNNDDEMQKAGHNLEGMARSFRGPALMAFHPPKHNSQTITGSFVIENMTTFIWELQNDSDAKNMSSAQKTLSVSRIKGAREGSYQKVRFEEVELGDKDQHGRNRTSIVAKSDGGTVLDKFMESSEIVLPDYMDEVLAVIEKAEKDDLTAYAIAKALKDRSDKTYVRADGKKARLPNFTALKAELGKLPLETDLDIGNGRTLRRTAKGKFTRHVAPIN